MTTANESGIAAGIARRIDVAMGRRRADLVIRGAATFNLVTGQMDRGDIALCGPWIVGTGDSYDGAEVLDADGLVCVPGFIDTHLHVESSLVTPQEFDRCVLSRGTTTAICDPHEIANVIGVPGLRYFLAAAERTVMDLRVQLSSCVPATSMETSGARIEAADLAPLIAHPKVIGLAEMMNYPGLLAADPGILAKLALFDGGHMDGHAPLVRGRDLNAYLAAGIRNDHESTRADEAAEKLAKGMHVLVREGSVAKDLEALAGLITPRTVPMMSFCTDDRNPLEIAEEGHLDHLVRKAIALGVAPVDAYCASSFSAARGFGLRDRGLVAPGYRADLVLLEDLADCRVARVIKDGRPVTRESFAGIEAPSLVGLNSVKLDPVDASVFAIPSNGPSGPVIGVVPGRIITEALVADLPYRGGQRHVDLERDYLKICVLARHGVNRNIGRAFVHGFGFKRGALASSVGHDSHNVCVVGADEADMALAVNRLIDLQGGFVAAADGKILAELALPVAGLISDRPHEHVIGRLEDLRRATAGMGCTLAEPFLQLAFLPLPVIPHLKLTDYGLVDVDRFELIPG